MVQIGHVGQLPTGKFSPPALRFDLFKPRGGLETAFHKLYRREEMTCHSANSAHFVGRHF